KALIIDVERKPKGPVVYLSRTHPDFLRRLLEFEIPEIREGIVEIKGVVRDPGKRAKVAVYSKDPKIDPVGACVGMRGSRIQAIVRELNGEKIDIIAWSENPEVFIARALAPAKVLRVIIVDRENKEARCLVQDEQLSLAIGKEGQNVTLAARLTGWKIDVKAQSAYHKEVEEEKRSKLTVDQLPVSDRIKKILREAGYPTAKEIMAASKEELMKLPGLGDKTVDKIYRAIYELLNVGG
ncbi:transcription termination/antitermination protein NusA, partial [bacterium]